jgi:hypothetical protein
MREVTSVVFFMQDIMKGSHIKRWTECWYDHYYTWCVWGWDEAVREVLKQKNSNPSLSINPEKSYLSEQLLTHSTIEELVKWLLTVDNCSYQQKLTILAKCGGNNWFISPLVSCDHSVPAKQRLSPKQPTCFQFCLHYCDLCLHFLSVLQKALHCNNKYTCKPSLRSKRM